MKERKSGGVADAFRFRFFEGGYVIERHACPSCRRVLLIQRARYGYGIASPRGRVVRCRCGARVAVGGAA